MTNESEARALARLATFESPTADRPAPDDEPRGSVGAQMVVSIVLPGAASLARRPVASIALLLAGVVAPIALGAWAFANRDDIVGFALDERFLRAAVVVAVAFVIVRLLAVAEVAHTCRARRGIGVWTALATVALLLLAAPVAWAAVRANDARSMVAAVFSGGGGPPLYETGRSGSGDVTNVLLLGGDAGPGRWGLRTDTMIVASIDESSGRMALISVPRNLTRLQFPPGSPLAQRFPNGFDDLANAVYPYVSSHDDLLAAYARDGLQPEAVAVAQAIGYSLGIDIDDYALVNMQGFIEVIDAVGGVTIDVGGSVPLPPSIPGGKHDIPASIGPGPVDMDGTLAIAYVRSRSADSDYQRMQRQREVLAALGSQISPRDALSGFGAVTGVVGDSVRTSLSPGEFTSLLDRLDDESAIVESVGLVPPLVTPGSPDYGRIREIAAAVERAVATGEPSGYGS